MRRSVACERTTPVKSIAGARRPVFYPTQLSVYTQCPERYLRKYVERRRVEEGFSPALAKGQAAHTILAECFDLYRCKGAFPTNLRDRAEYYLPRGPYPHDRAWLHDVASIVDQVEFGLISFDRSAEVLAIEDAYEYAYPGSAGCPLFVLRAKVDRVIRYQDGAIEHADYKTGNGTYTDPIQNVVSRIVVGQHFRGEYTAVRSSTVFLAGQAVRVDELTREQVQEVWQQIKQTVRAITSGDDWQPRRSSLCEWCPFYGNGCSLDVATQGDEELAEWLDGAAD